MVEPVEAIVGVLCGGLIVVLACIVWNLIVARGAQKAL